MRRLKNNQPTGSEVVMDNRTQQIQCPRPAKSRGQAGQDLEEDYDDMPQSEEGHTDEDGGKTAKTRPEHRQKPQGNTRVMDQRTILSTNQGVCP
jgi:hypothetical protein